MSPRAPNIRSRCTDERFLSLVSNRLDWPDGIGGYWAARSPLNPITTRRPTPTAYHVPALPGKAVSTIAGDDPAGIEDSYDTTIEWGRRLAAGVDTVTILVVFLIGSTLFGKRTGLAGAGLYALAVLPTQLAHFWTVDPFLTFFGALALLQGVALARERSTARSGLLYATLGVTLGLAVACKINGAFFFVVPVGVTALRWGLRDDRRMGFRWRGEIEGQLLPDGSIKRPEAPAMSWMNDVSFLFMAAALALITFRIAQPYAFTGPHFWEMGINQQWLDDIRRELDFQQGKADYPPFVQWAGRTPFLWPLRNMVLWGMGPALGIAAWVSFVAAGSVHVPAAGNDVPAATGIHPADLRVPGVAVRGVHALLRTDLPGALRAGGLGTGDALGLREVRTRAARVEPAAAATAPRSADRAGCGVRGCGCRGCRHRVVGDGVPVRLLAGPSANRG
jgi:hypothetical protein